MTESTIKLVLKTYQVFTVLVLVHKYPHTNGKSGQMHNCAKTAKGWLCLLSVGWGMRGSAKFLESASVETKTLRPGAYLPLTVSQLLGYVNGFSPGPLGDWPLLPAQRVGEPTTTGFMGVTHCS